MNTLTAFFQVLYSVVGLARASSFNLSEPSRNPVYVAARDDTSIQIFMIAMKSIVFCDDMRGFRDVSVTEQYVKLLLSSIETALNYHKYQDWFNK